MDGSPLSKDSLADNPITDVDEWLRRHLGRRLTVALIVALVSPDEFADGAAHRLAAGLARYTEIRMVMQPAVGDLATYLDSLVAIDPEVVLVWSTLPAGKDGSSGDAPLYERGLRHVLGELEARSLLDRACVALIGPHVTRLAARRLGFESGFPARRDVAELAAALAREGVAVDERRRQGSSPPCYL